MLLEEVGCPTMKLFHRTCWSLDRHHPVPQPRRSQRLPSPLLEQGAKVVRLCLLLCFRLAELQEVSHSVEARFGGRGELRGPHRAVGEGAAREGTVDHFDLFTLGVEDQAMLPDDCSTAQGVYPNLAFLTRRDALSAVYSDLFQVLPSPLGRGPREEKRGT